VKYKTIIGVNGVNNYEKTKRHKHIKPDKSTVGETTSKNISHTSRSGDKT
jgi:hypothetical protein